ncbi:MAG: 3-hydroxyacyl-ACP dehydratase FabZ family protein [Desulfopila sp.]
MNTSITITEDSHWFSGHFPDNPILPGVAQLKYVVDLISAHCGIDLHIADLSRVKFRKIIHPGEVLTIEVTTTGTKNQYLFYITSGNEDVCSGKISCAPTKKTTNS